MAPFLPLTSVLSYWNVHPVTAQLFAEHCSFTHIADQLNAMGDPIAEHAPNSGTQYHRLFSIMYSKYSQLAPQIRRDGKLFVLRCAR